MGTLDTKIANIDQAAAWDGHEGEVWAEQADRYELASARYRALLLEACRLRSDHQVLDVGCGTGALTRDVARTTTTGAALGIDLSTRMLERARQRSAAAGLGNTTFVHGDAQVHAFVPTSFDVVTSCFGAMFFNDPPTAFTNIGAALRPGGLFTTVAWRSLAENHWLTAIRGALALGRDLPVPPPGAPSPFGLADVDRVRSVLDGAGFSEVDFKAVDEPMYLGTDAADTLEFSRSMGIVEGLLESLDADQSARAWDNLTALYAEHETPEGVLLDSAAWLITAVRR